MNRSILVFTIICLFAGCKENKKAVTRIPVAEINKAVLYYDEIPQLVQKGINDADSTALVHNYINKWAKKELLLQKAEENLSSGLKADIASQIEETRTNLLIYQYQRQMMLEKMDTLISDTEIEKYYSENGNNFLLSSNIVKALFIKLPLETPELDKIKRLARSNNQSDLQQLETTCFHFAEKFDDFNEAWIPMSRLSVELKNDIANEEDFLKKNTFFETTDSTSVYLITIRDYKLRSSLAPYEYVKDDIKRIIWNTRRFEFIQSLENGIFNDALKKNNFKIY